MDTIPPVSRRVKLTKIPMVKLVNIRLQSLSLGEETTTWAQTITNLTTTNLRRVTEPVITPHLSRTPMELPRPRCPPVWRTTATILTSTPPPPPPPPLWNTNKSSNKEKYTFTTRLLYRQSLYVNVCRACIYNTLNSILYRVSFNLVKTKIVSCRTSPSPRQNSSAIIVWVGFERSPI